MFASRRQSKSKKTSRLLRSAKPAKPKAGPAATVLHRKQQALREKEEQLRAETEQLKQLIEDAPRLREEQARRRREELASDTRLTTSRTSLGDKRYEASVAGTANLGNRRLRREKRDGKLFFIFLCVVFVGLVVWIYQLVNTYLQRF